MPPSTYNPAFDGNNNSGQPLSSLFLLARKFPPVSPSVIPTFLYPSSPELTLLSIFSHSPLASDASFFKSIPHFLLFPSLHQSQWAALQMATRLHRALSFSLPNLLAKATLIRLRELLPFYPALSTIGSFTMPS
jgi:hypothetical protein